MELGISRRNLPLLPLAFGTLAILWGGSFVAIEVGLETVPPLLFAALRYDVAGAVVLAYALATTDHWRPRGVDDWQAVAVAGGLVVAVYQAMLYMGEQHLPGAVAAVLVSLSPVLTAGFAAAVFPSQGLRPPQYLGVGLGFLGVVLVVDPFGASAPLVGVGLVLAAAASFSFGSVLVRPLSPSLPARSLQAWAMLGGAVLLHAGSLLRGEPLAVEWTPTAVGTLAYLALGSGAFAYLLYFEMLDRVGAAELNLVSYLEPVVATALSWALLDHALDGTALAGFLTIFAGFLVVKHRAIREAARAGLAPLWDRATLRVDG